MFTPQCDVRHTVGSLATRTPAWTEPVPQHLELVIAMMKTGPEPRWAGPAGALVRRYLALAVAGERRVATA